ncbi:uracil-DNA glycosylase [Desulfobulbus alkaliphilus]|uniref:uracil-DNA glycosylase n=1 Tax=Desulfobulbus alkaliphilus TaxID=869814 RepID=UPI001964CFC7|nr:uracil-DNA glycosylase [Desulfobulbus alkaliphilus]MBM9536863.1 uracil-DNA glycosylase [Desulfobulbus alkaliphilus]
MSSEKKDTVNKDSQGKMPGLDPPPVVRIANGIRNILHFHRQMGIDSYPLTFSWRQDREKIKGARQKTVHVSTGSGERPDYVVPSSDVTPPWTAEAMLERLRVVHEEVKSCSQCGLAKVGQGRSLGGEPAGPPSVLVVGDYCILNGDISEGTHFGVEEDVMLWNMMRAIGCTPAQVFITNVIKCRLPASLHPDRESLRRCRAFLHREIDLLRPRVICTMGEMAAQALLGDHATLLRLRGRRHQFRCGDDRHQTIPVIVSFHPRFLLRHPDMKKAAWGDLQKVQKHLDPAAIS